MNTDCLLIKHAVAMPDVQMKEAQTPVLECRLVGDRADDQEQCEEGCLGRDGVALPVIWARDVERQTKGEWWILKQKARRQNTEKVVWCSKV